MQSHTATLINSPVGELVLVQCKDKNALSGLVFEENWFTFSKKWPNIIWAKTEFLNFVHSQLHEYFSGKRTHFEFELDPQGTPFQMQAWGALRKIPYGNTLSYADQCSKIGKPKAARAVGSANGKNPISIVIPCHRVIAKTGRLGGYGGGLKAKSLLLQLESKSL